MYIPKAHFQTVGITKLKTFTVFFVHLDLLQLQPLLCLADVGVVIFTSSCKGHIKNITHFFNTSRLNNSNIWRSHIIRWNINCTWYNLGSKCLWIRGFNLLFCFNNFLLKFYSVAKTSDNFTPVVENVPSVCTYRRCKMRKIQMNYRYLSTGSRIMVIFVFLGGLKRYWGGLKSNPQILLLVIGLLFRSGP